MSGGGDVAARRKALLEEATWRQRTDGQIEALRRRDATFFPVKHRSQEFGEDDSERGLYPFECERLAVPIIKRWLTVTAELLKTLAVPGPLEHHELSFMRDDLAGLSRRVSDARLGYRPPQHVKAGRSHGWRKQIEADLVETGLTRAQARKMLRSVAPAPKPRHRAQR